MIQNSDNEFTAIRNEISMRIQLINTQENTALLMSAALWATGVAISTEPLDSRKVLVLNLLALFLLCAPIFLIIPISKKSGENLYQIEVLSCFVKVFYEYKTLKERALNTPIFMWEFLNSQTSKLKISAKRLTSTFFLNNSYTIISAISVVLFTLKFVVMISDIKLLFGHYEYYTFLIFTVVLLAAGIFVTVKAHTWSSVESNMKAPEKDILKSFLEHGMALGIIQLENGLDEAVETICNSDMSCFKKRSSLTFCMKS